MFGLPLRSEKRKKKKKERWSLVMFGLCPPRSRIKGGNSWIQWWEGEQERLGYYEMRWIRVLLSVVSADVFVVFGLEQDYKIICLNAYSILLRWCARLSRLWTCVCVVCVCMCVCWLWIRLFVLSGVRKGHDLVGYVLAAVVVAMCSSCGVCLLAQAICLPFKFLRREKRVLAQQNLSATRNEQTASTFAPCWVVFAR